MGMHSSHSLFRREMFEKSPLLADIGGPKGPNPLAFYTNENSFKKL
jgi:hypothetical protein